MCRIESFVVNTGIENWERTRAAVKSLELSRGIPGGENQLSLRIFVNVAFQKNDEVIVNSAVQKTRPGPNGVACKFQVFSNAAHEFGKDDVDRNSVSVEAIRAGAEHQIVAQPSHADVPDAPKMIGCKPPEKVKKVRTGKLGDSVPDNRGKIEILDVLAVHVDFKFGAEPRNPLDNHPLGSEALVQEWRNDGHSGLMFWRDQASRSRWHYFTRGVEQPSGMRALNLRDSIALNTRA